MSKEEIKSNADEEKLNEQPEQQESAEEETVNSGAENGEGDMQAKYNELNDRFLRLYSEFENFRKRTAKERLDLMKTAGSDLMKEILPIIDDFERAMKANETAEDIQVIKDGFTLIHSKLMHKLQSKGLKEMDLIGQPFDADQAEAIANLPAPSEDQKGKVMDVVEKGYVMNDIIIRYAKVVVGN